MDTTLPAPTPTHASVTLPATGESARMARQFVARTLEAWELHRMTDDAVFVTSELVTNVVVHASGSPVLDVRAVNGRIRIEVRDLSPAMPVRRTGGATGGWGLAAVEDLSANWGAHREGSGKVVWSELEATADDADRATA
jgi:anti-sigma regulatory factor (Ser/Thr protein kinase)